MSTVKRVGNPSFLAAPGEAADWRLALAYEAAADAGVLDALPGTVADLAARCDLRPGPLRAVLDLLAVWEVVAVDPDGRYVPGSAAPSWPDDAMLGVLAGAIRRWAALLGPRLRDRTGGDAPPAAPLRLDLLAANVGRLVGPVVDACLTHVPHASRVLDLGGGHGAYALEFARRGVPTTMQDLPAVVEDAERGDRLRAGGIELFAGDLRTTLPPGPFDLVLCSTVTNMFDETVNRDLYRRLHEVITPGGGLAIVSYLRGRTPVAAAFALQMLAWTDGGDAHGEDDYRRWLADAGFGEVLLHDFTHPPQTLVLARR
jgi:SAM-dependent methyltransferase